MAIDITGITNENEFYTHHYLSAILENDLKEVFKEWKRKEDEEETPQPYIRLRSLRKDFFTSHALLEKEKNIAKRLTFQRGLVAQLLDSLGYQYHPQMVDVDDEGTIPLIGGIAKADGSPELWIIEALTNHGEENDPLKLPFVEAQYEIQDEEITKILDIPFEEIITRQVFGRTEPPRWVILVTSSQLLLLDRSKWHEKRLLRFNIREILDRRKTTTLQATAALLHRDSICPKDGMPLLDTLDENSHKHAFAVSEDLKYSLRKAIELLGNEAVYYLQEKLHEKTYGKDMASQLTRECLRYMYRMLFLFYIEARPELGYLPNKSEEYRKGYSLESLRDLEMIQLTTEESKNRFFLHESIKTLFNLLYDGFKPKQMDMFASPDHNTFRITPLRSHLFDPKQTPLLNKVKFRNFVLQEIIELMSLTRPKKGKKNRRGRISYAQLGINQLGAVYEALLSYQGFFAETELFEVKKAKDKHNVLETAYFVKEEDIEQYTEDERVYNNDGSLMIYEKGTFIYRLAGRDREKSASYYTPEVLTKCLVKYALKELLKDKSADDILQLTVCEPAMGSAAFLNEAVNQLAKAYLDLKQKETDQLISHEDYPKELQKVKMYIADNNVYGVDLNPVAVELAEVSLWLNTIYEGAFVPWFGMQLVCGNSLIGARRQVFSKKLLKKVKRGEPTWLSEVPVRVMPEEKRKPDTVYHFLLPDKGMAEYKDKVIKQMAGDEIKAINEWRKEFTEPFSESEVKQLKRLSAAIDKLWQRHAEMQRDIDSRTTDPLHVFSQPAPDERLQKTTTEEKDRIFQKEMFSKDVRNSSPYRRLKLVMDYWCALWFWPIQKAELLPSRAEYLFDLTLLLEGNLYDAEAEVKGQQSLFPDTRPKQFSVDMVDEFGFVNVDKMCEESNRLSLVQKIASRYRFLHWELEFADLFLSRKGFDLVIGNPPWILVEWKEGSVIGDFDPLYILRKYNATELSDFRNAILEEGSTKSVFLNSYVESESTQKFLNSKQNYHMLEGMKANLFKCFIPNSWYLTNENGVSSFITDEGIFNDPSGGYFRELCYKKLVSWFYFENEKKLFQEVGNAKKFELIIYGKARSEISFNAITNLYHPVTIDNCFNHPGNGPIPGIKNERNEWELLGHKDRIVNIDRNVLKLFVKLYDKPGVSPERARLAIVHTHQIVEVLKKIVKQRTRLEDIKDSFFSTQHWNETTAQQNGTIKRKTYFPSSLDDFILSGPHFYTANPLYQTPRKVCNTHRAYDAIDLVNVPESYLPRSNYFPNCSQKDYRVRTPSPQWDKNKRVTDYYRVVSRTMLSQAGERTLISAIIPPKVAHIDLGFSLTFSNVELVPLVNGLFSSLPYDFFVKTTGKGHFRNEVAYQLPIPINGPQFFLNCIRVRALLLNCLTTHYMELWENCWNDNYKLDSWAQKDNRLSTTIFKSLSQQWSGNFILKDNFSRRQALVELDVIIGMILGFSVDELKTIYRVQFPVLRQNEADTWYDQKGRIVFTCSKGLPGVGFPRKKTKTEPIGWEDIKDMQAGAVDRTVLDETQPGGPVERTITYHAPFDRCDREKDYEEVWDNFERRFKDQEGDA